MILLRFLIIDIYRNKKNPTRGHSYEFTINLTFENLNIKFRYCVVSDTRLL